MSVVPLQRLPHFDGRPGPLVVVVMDGVGVGIEDDYNAVHLARMPVLRGLMARAPYRTLRAHGTAVGLPSDDDMGNSEVGHNALGAGRIFPQGARLVNQAIESGEIFKSDTWGWLTGPCKAEGRTLHFMGLLSDGNVHSHIDHLFAMLSRAAKEGVQRVRIHALLDGRDVPPRSAIPYVQRLEACLAELSTGGRDYAIASGGGRMVITMDRYEADWAMVARGWQHHVHGEGRGFPSAVEAIEALREESGKDDQFLPPFVIQRDGRPVGPIQSGDSVVLFNFRGDRALEITRAFEGGPAFDKFDRGAAPKVRFAGMMQYDGDLLLPTRYLVSPPAIDRVMSAYLTATGITQLACSETQKFGHVTYFWNGNRSGRFHEELEHWIEIPSDNVGFEERPWMKSAEIVDATLDALRATGARFGRINFANGDMVGHTGLVTPTIVAMEAVDLALGRLLKGIEALGGMALITADHGNAADMAMRDSKGRPKVGGDGQVQARSSHSLNPVPLVIFDPAARGEYHLRGDLPEAGIGNVAATAMELMGYAPPADYEPSLLTFQG